MNIVTILLIVNVFAAIGIIALVLMQQSKGDMGSAFGGGGSQSMFGSRGSSNFLSRSTSTLVVVFFISSLALAYTYAKRNADEQIDSITVEQSSEVPLVDDPSAEIPAADDSVPSIEGASSSAVEGVIEQSADAEVPSVEDLEAAVPSAEEIEAAVDQAVETVEDAVPGTE